MAKKVFEPVYSATQSFGQTATDACASAVTSM